MATKVYSLRLTEEEADAFAALGGGDVKAGILAGLHTAPDQSEVLARLDRLEALLVELKSAPGTSTALRQAKPKFDLKKDAQRQRLQKQIAALESTCMEDGTKKNIGKITRDRREAEQLKEELANLD